MSFFFQRLRLDLELRKQTRGIPDSGGASNFDYTVGFLDLKGIYGPSSSTEDQGRIFANLIEYKLL